MSIPNIPAPQLVVRQGPRGDKGEEGLSAYAIATQKGFVGTISQWLASLKGEQGDTGPKGDTGNTGLQGPPGNPGDINFKKPVRAATTANITLSGTQTIDGVALVAGDRVLVKNQTTASQNGIYIVAAGTWTRSTDFDTWSEVVSACVPVQAGTISGDKLYICTENDGGTVGTNIIAFTGLGFSTLVGNLALTQIANIAAGTMLVRQPGAGSGPPTEATMTAAGYALMDDANADAQLNTLGGSTVGKAVFSAANAQVARAVLGVGAPDFFARHSVSSGTYGGSAVAAVLSQLPLNSLEFNHIAGASLTSNQITLPAGTYYIKWMRCFNRTNATKTALYNVTDGTYIYSGRAAYFGNSSYCGGEIGGEAYFTIAGAKTIELRYLAGIAQATDGLGFPAGGASTSEVYGTVEIWKVA